MGPLGAVGEFIYIVQYQNHLGMPIAYPPTVTGLR